METISYVIKGQMVFATLTIMDKSFLSLYKSSFQIISVYTLYNRWAVYGTTKDNFTSNQLKSNNYRSVYFVPKTQMAQPIFS